MVLKFVSGQKKFKKFEKTLPQKILEKFLKNYSKKIYGQEKNFKKLKNLTTKNYTKKLHKKFMVRKN